MWLDTLSEAQRPPRAMSPYTRRQRTERFSLGSGENLTLAGLPSSLAAQDRQGRQSHQALASQRVNNWQRSASHLRCSPGLRLSRGCEPWCSAFAPGPRMVRSCRAALGGDSREIQLAMELRLAFRPPEILFHFATRMTDHLRFFCKPGWLRDQGSKEILLAIHASAAVDLGEGRGRRSRSQPI